MENSAFVLLFTLMNEVSEGTGSQKNIDGFCHELWNKVLTNVQIESLVSDGNFTMWWKDPNSISLASIDGDTYNFEVKNFMVKSQFQSKFHDLLIRQLKLANPAISEPKLQFNTHKGKPKRTISEEDDVVIIDEPATTSKSSDSASSFKSGKFSTHLNPRYTFDTFIVGRCNDLAYATAQAAAKNPGQRYNPVFIYGGVGLGKTHLIQAIGNGILAADHTKKVLYVTTEEFVNDFVEHLRKKTPEEFTKKYRALDALIVDDIQFIAGKKANQEAFFNTFNALQQANKQIVLSSDRPPAEIPTLDDRMRSRFQMGMTIDVSLPDYETRVAIIETKAAMNSTVELPHETAEYIANEVRTNVRELEGALNQVMAYAEMQNVVPTVEFASQILASARPSQTKHLSARQVIEKTAKHFGIKVTEIKSASRSANIILPRQIAMYLLRTELHLSYPQIARELGRGDHTTAMHAIKKIEGKIKLDAVIRDEVSSVKGDLYA